jgi:hypothetical protein
MEPSTSRTNARQKRQQELRAQIAALQAQLVPDDNVVIKAPGSPKRKQPEPSTLVPATPSPSPSIVHYHHSSLNLASRKETASGGEG